MRQRVIIGLTGAAGSGKGTVAKYLTSLVREQGIKVLYHSLSDEIRDEIKRENMPVERENQKLTANTFRSRIGTGVWALLAASRIKEQLVALDQNEEILVLIDSIRTPGEVSELRRQFGNRFKLLAIDAPFKRIKTNLRQRMREDESSQVLQNEQAMRDMINTEMGSGEPSFGHDVSTCLKMADWPPLWNDGSEADLEEKVRELAKEEILPLFSPDFDAGYTVST